MFGEAPENSINQNETINTEVQEVVKESEIQGTLPPENPETISKEEKHEIDFSEIYDYISFLYEEDENV